MAYINAENKVLSFLNREDYVGALNKHSYYTEDRRLMIMPGVKDNHGNDKTTYAYAAFDDGRASTRLRCPGKIASYMSKEEKRAFAVIYSGLRF